MKSSKRILAVALSLIMLLSSFAIGVSALTYSPTTTSGEIVISITADKTEVKAGDVVTFNLCIDAGSVTNLGATGSLIVYNGSQLTPVGTSIPTFRTYQGQHATWANQNSTAGNLNFPITTNALVNSNFTAEEKAYYTKAIMFPSSSTSSANRWNPASKGESYVSFQFTVADSVVAGDEIWIGLHEAGFKGNGNVAQSPSKIVYYGDGTTAITAPLSMLNLTNSMIKLTVAEDKEPSPVFNNKSQIRFNAPPVGTAKADFDVRTRGYISAAELEALCGGTVTEEAITDVGFVYFAGEDFDLATAAEVAKNGSAGAYTRYKCKYMQDAGTEYRWACLVTDPTYDGTLQSVAYITVGGETYITDAAQETSFADLYDRNINSYLGA